MHFPAVAHRKEQKTEPENRKQKRKTGRLTDRFLRVFLLASLLPLTVITIAACIAGSNLLMSRTQEVMTRQMAIIQKSIDSCFEEYQTALSNLYNNSDFTAQLEKLDAESAAEAVAARTSLDTMAQDIMYLHPGIIGVLFFAGENSFSYDAVTMGHTGSAVFSAENRVWQKTAAEAKEQASTVYSDCVQVVAAGEEVNVFYIAHQVLDRTDTIGRVIGSVTLCIDEEMIRESYMGDTADDTIAFLCDRGGVIVSASDDRLIAQHLGWYGQVFGLNQVPELTENLIRTIVGKPSLDCRVYQCSVVGGQFLQVTVHNLANVRRGLFLMIAAIVIVELIVICFVLLGLSRFSSGIDRNMDQILGVMNEAGQGDYQARIKEISNDELGRISEHFNKMVGKIAQANEEMQLALENEKTAEIRSLEAQINPHFLYNTLDSINWVALGNRQYQISQMLGSLSDILRYNVQKSTEQVTLGEDIVHLKNYVLLQQERFHYAFQCWFDIPEELNDHPIRKLLLQPLVENAMIHAFPYHPGEDTITVRARKLEDGRLELTVEDNGCGMEPELVKMLNAFDYRRDSIKQGIGMLNVFMRIKYYYGDNGGFLVNSGDGGTRICLILL